MPGIEYSPNSRAGCQGCHCKIAANCVRVNVKSASPYQRNSFKNKYYHAECYTNYKDFTKFYGFYSLKPEDQKKYAPEELFPEDYIDEQKLLGLVVDKDNTTSTTKKRVACTTDKNEEKESKKAKRSPGEFEIVITGLMYAKAQAVEKVKLVRGPQNLSIFFRFSH